MNPSFNFKDAETYLDSLLVFGIKLGLENMVSLNQLLGDPASSLKFIHVAGTNGKGSTCAMIATACKYSGLKTAFYSSPYLVNFLERWRINGTPIQEELYLEAIQEIMLIEDQLIEITGVKPTYFEVLTAAALIIFQKEKCELVVWETGMGGRLDATNIVNPLMSIITNIAMDHGSYLGETIEEVASEKAGIIKANTPFICGELDPKLKSIFAQKAQKSSQYYMDTDFLSHRQGTDIQYQGTHELNYKLRLLGDHQVSNSSIAIKALEVLEDQGILESAIIAAKGIQYAHWPGRIQELPNQIYVDGAHNPAAMEKLSHCFTGKKFTVLCGMMEDKDIKATLKKLAPICKNFIAIPINIPRAIQAETLADIAKETLNCPCSFQNNWETCINNIEGKVLITGSLYLSGEVLSKLAPDSALRCDILE
ncbi:bifunctional folylpolyglutamate synthase/dihydrofolate synthase [Lentisphaera profundi]|uniref:Dihydrofolate synthase/folylpolyglutamate synthase n=1 Tax=Lentisphaera profundi TaxID=1658616 RepID=A0ABY7VR02_9BACT|nr:folylpolyglutamate synthase/dihydrofolate synthase family protein [Lentisphaera profundi]WDE95648.1 bifunctional folylpolyglutamate synthase/dihydrofolate synthase [Lentisphaera profundi]